MGSAKVSEHIHKGVSSAIYNGLGAGLRATGERLRRPTVAAPGLASRTPLGQVHVSAVNGIIGDRLAEEQSGLAIELAVRSDGRDVPLDPASLAEAFPAATPDLVVFLHGLSESERFWHRGANEGHPSYGARLADETSWTPVYLRANTGLPIAENGVALASLLDSLVASWPIRRAPHRPGRPLDGRADHEVRVRRRHRRGDRSWTNLVTDIVTLGTPHLGRAHRAWALARRQGPGPDPGGGPLRTDPRVSLRRHPRPASRPRRRRAEPSPRPLPPGRRHPWRPRTAIP